MISRRPSLGTFVAPMVSPSQHEGYLTSLERMETLVKIAEWAGVQAQFVSRQVSEPLTTLEVARELGID